MYRRIQTVADIRWLPAKNTGASEIPGFGAVACSDLNSDGILEVARPTVNGETVYINSAQPIAVGAYGIVTMESPIHALYETGDGTPANGETWGAEASSYKLNKGNTGFTICGGVTNGRVFVERSGLGGSSGVPTFSGARVRRTTSKTIDNVTATAIDFDAERFDTDAYHSLVSSTERLTAPTTGYYLIGGHVQWDGNTTGTRTLGIRLNGATYIANVEIDALADASDTPEQSVTSLYQLTATDYAELVVSQDSGSGLAVDAVEAFSPEFWITRLGN